MNIPSVPTDSLYKFMALSGIILIIFPFYITNIQIDELSDERFEVEKRIAIAELKTKELHDIAGSKHYRLSFSGQQLTL